MANQTPSTGRIVRYMLPGGVERAAIITSVPPNLDPKDVEQRVNLKVILEPRDATPAGHGAMYRGSGTECWCEGVQYDGGKLPAVGTWHWPEVTIASGSASLSGGPGRPMEPGSDAQKQADTFEEEQMAKRNNPAPLTGGIEATSK